MDVLADGHSISRANLAQRTKGTTVAVDSRAQKDLRWGDVQHLDGAARDEVFS